MSQVLTTYSGKDVNFTLTSPLLGQPIQAGGVAEKGIAEIRVRMLVTQSVLQVAMDGSVVPSVMPGDNGEIELQVWQTSTIHEQILELYNLCKTARDQGDVSNWFGANIVIQSIVDGTSHNANGVGIQKIPDKAYAEQAGRISWIFVCANLLNQ